MTEYECVESAAGDLLKEVFRLRSECYSADLGREIGPCADRYDGRENCRSYVIFRVGESRGLGTIRPCVYEPTRPDLTVPVLELYPDDVRVVLGAATPFVQSTHFVFSNDYRADGLRPKLLLFREVFRAAVDHRASHILTVIRDKLLPDLPGTAVRELVGGTPGGITDPLGSLRATSKPTRTSVRLARTRNRIVTK
jgi:hypothetical protein